MCYIIYIFVYYLNLIILRLIFLIVFDIDLKNCFIICFECSDEGKLEY